jgi:hypothetical protein
VGLDAGRLAGLFGYNSEAMPTSPPEGKKIAVIMKSSQATPPVDLHQIELIPNR